MITQIGSMAIEPVFRSRSRIRPDPYFFDLKDPDPQLFYGSGSGSHPAKTSNFFIISGEITEFKTKALISELWKFIQIRENVDFYLLNIEQCRL